MEKIQPSTPTPISTPNAAVEPSPEKPVLEEQPAVESQAVPSPAPTSSPSPAPVTLEERLLDISQYSYDGGSVKSGDGQVLESVVISGQLTEEYHRNGQELRLTADKLEPLKIAYPLDECLPQSPSEGSLLIVVTPDGQLDRSEWVSSSGYGVLDQKAIATLDDYPMPTPESQQIPGALVGYGLKVVVENYPEDCP